jgi:4-hydroxy-3-polyprenylbenzoate decarboxylase
MPRRRAESGPDRLVVGISGASGAIYGIRLLEALRPLPVETHLVISRSAEMTLAYEMGLKPPAVRALADASYAAGDVGAAIASGSFQTIGMIVAPCSVRTLAEIASGVTSSLLTRAADVMLKERRRLVLLVRESPLHAVHLKNMLAVTEMGAVVAPPVPAFYNRPQSVEEVVDHAVGRALDLFGIDTGLVRRWEGPPQAD